MSQSKKISVGYLHQCASTQRKQFIGDEHVGHNGVWLSNLSDQGRINSGRTKYRSFINANLNQWFIDHGFTSLNEPTGVHTSVLERAINVLNYYHSIELYGEHIITTPSGGANSLKRYSGGWARPWRKDQGVASVRFRLNPVPFFRSLLEQPTPSKSRSEARSLKNVMFGKVETRHIDDELIRHTHRNAKSIWFTQPELKALDLLDDEQLIDTTYCNTIDDPEETEGTRTHRHELMSISTALAYEILFYEKIRAKKRRAIASQWLEGLGMSQTYTKAKSIQSTLPDSSIISVRPGVFEIGMPESFVALAVRSALRLGIYVCHDINRRTEFKSKCESPFDHMFAAVYSGETEVLRKVDERAIDALG